MSITYGKGFEPTVRAPMRQKVDTLQAELSKLPQYEPETKHYFHAGMYCREVWRDAGVLVVGKVHKKEHFYLIVSGTVAITTDDGVQLVTGPHLLKSKAGTKRAVYSETPALCMTFHVCDSVEVDAAEKELVEDDETVMYGPGNQIENERREVLK
jgi:hypothetical protein